MADKLLEYPTVAEALEYPAVVEAIERLQTNDYRHKRFTLNDPEKSWSTLILRFSEADDSIMMSTIEYSEKDIWWKIQKEEIN